MTVIKYDGHSGPVQDPKGAIRLDGIEFGAAHQNGIDVLLLIFQTYLKKPTLFYLPMETKEDREEIALLMEGLIQRLRQKEWLS